MSNVSSPSTAQVLAPLALGALVMIVTVSLSGCAQLIDGLHQEHSEKFGTYAEARADWVGVAIPAWIPSDATDLQNVATSDETNAVIRVDSASALPAACVASPRHGLPFTARSWTPTDWPDEIERCGDYEVMGVDGGWVGWYSAEAEGAKPAATLNG